MQQRRFARVEGPDCGRFSPRARRLPEGSASGRTTKWNRENRARESSGKRTAAACCRFTTLTLAPQTRSKSNSCATIGLLPSHLPASWCRGNGFQFPTDGNRSRWCGGAHLARDGIGGICRIRMFTIGASASDTIQASFSRWVAAFVDSAADSKLPQIGCPSGFLRFSKWVKIRRFPSDAV